MDDDKNDIDDYDDTDIDKSNYCCIILGFDIFSS